MLGWLYCFAVFSFSSLFSSSVKSLVRGGCEAKGSGICTCNAMDHVMKTACIYSCLHWLWMDFTLIKWENQKGLVALIKCWVLINSG